MAATHSELAAGLALEHMWSANLRCKGTAPVFGGKDGSQFGILPEIFRGWFMQTSRPQPCAKGAKLKVDLPMSGCTQLDWVSPRYNSNAEATPMSANKPKPTKAQQGRRLGGSPSNRIGRAGMARSEEKKHGWIEIQHIINRM
jgi:hypothetical protein